MTAYAVQSPFFDLVNTIGVPVTAGRIFIGVAGMDPETSPQAVYWDAAQTIPASQPITTNGGYPVRAGTPAQFFTGASFSIRAYDTLGVPIYYLPSVQTNDLRPMLSVTGGSALIGFIQSGAGAIARTVQDKLRDTVCALDFAGVDPTGTTDSTAGIQAALNAHPNVFLGVGKFLISSELVPAFAGQRIYGAGIYGYGVSDGTSASTLMQTNPAKGIIKNTKYGLTIADIQMDYTGTPTAGALVDSSGSGTTIRNVWANACWNGFYFHDNTGHMFEDVTLDNCGSSALNVTNTNDVFGNNFVFTASSTGGVNGLVSLAGYVQAVTLENGDVLGGLYSLGTQPTGSTVSTRASFCKFTAVYFDSSQNGVSLNGCSSFSFENCWFSNRPGNGVTVGGSASTDAMSFNNCTFAGNGLNGLNLKTGATNTSVKVCWFIGNSQSAGANACHGIAVDPGVSKFIIEGNFAYNNADFSGQQGYGIFIQTGASDYYLVINNILHGNGTAALFDGGSGTNKFVTQNLS